MQIIVEPPETKADLRWRMLGVPVRVAPWFWIGAAFLGWQDRITLAPMLVWIGCVFVSILLHEFGHALTAKAFGAYGVRVVLYQFGGLAISEGGLRRWQRVVELLMGPGAGFILWGILFGLSYVFDYDALRVGGEAEFHGWLALQFLLEINLIWGLFNLLPVYPLDGGQITKELIVARNPRSGARLAHTLCMVVALAVGLCYVVWAMWRGGNRDMLPAIMFFYFAFENYRFRQAYGEFEAEEDYAPRQPWERDPDWWKKR